jgi:hypothetical protein
MPGPDWNWFFSSLAQSAAAIVGIFGAFIVTKILTSQSAFAEKCRQAQALIAMGQKISDEANRLSFDWYHRNDSETEFEELEDLLEKDGDLTPDELYEKLNFSPYLPKADVIKMIANAKSRREDRIRREEEKRKQEVDELRRFGIGSTMAGNMSRGSLSMRGLHVPGMSQNLNKEREEIDHLYTEAKHHAQVVSDFHALIITHPESSPAITTSLVLILALFFVGVIYPLSCMPLQLGVRPTFSVDAILESISSYQGTLLCLISLLFSAMIAMFFVMNIRMRYPQNLLRQIEGYKNLSIYSKYFAIREKNKASGK